MSFMLTESQNIEFELPPAGTFPARCHSLVELGTQQSEYQAQISRSGNSKQ